MAYAEWFEEAFAGEFSPRSAQAHMGVQRFDPHQHNTDRNGRMRWVRGSGAYWSPTIIYHPIPYYKTKFWMYAVGGFEVGWSLFCQQDRFGNIHIIEADLPEQEVTQNEVFVTKDDWGIQDHRLFKMLFEELGKEGFAEFMALQVGVGHSHVRMNVFESTQDEEENLMSYKKKAWALQEIRNQRGAALFNLHLFGVTQGSLSWLGYPILPNLPHRVIMEGELPEEVRQEVLAEFNGDPDNGIPSLQERCLQEVNERVRVRFNGPRFDQDGVRQPSGILFGEARKRQKEIAISRYVEQCADRSTAIIIDVSGGYTLSPLVGYPWDRPVIVAADAGVTNVDVDTPKIVALDDDRLLKFDLAVIDPTEAVPKVLQYEQNPDAAQLPDNADSDLKQ